MITKIKKSMRMLLILSVAATCLVQVSCQKQKSEVSTFDLRCEYLSNPLGINNVNPGLSWKIKSDKNGASQSAYQLLVAGDSTLLTEQNADLWNSGKVSSTASLLVPYDGKQLASRSLAWWKVRVWDENGNASPWSEAAIFSVGLLENTDWSADYIGMPEDDGISESPMLRQTFTLSEPGEKVLLYVNSLGYHEIYVNGKKVGEDVLSPAVSQFDKRSQAIAYDVSAYLKTGENDLIIWLGSGWYSYGLPGVVHKGPLVKAQLEQLKSGKWQAVVKTDETWKGRMSEYVTTGEWRSGRYGGEKVDGSKIVSDWTAENLNRLDWLPITKVEIPDYNISAQMVEGNRIREIFTADSIIEIAKNTYLVDMGTNLTGWIKVQFPALQKGQEIRMEYCDHLEDGNFVDRNQMDIYLASGNGNETFQNKFNYHGFRYIRISNLPEKPSKESVTAYLIQTDFKMASGFECSDPEMNRIHDMIYYTLRCLSLGGYLVDCPQIERLGYGGDGNASTQTAQIMFDLAPMYNNWLQAWEDCVREDGGMPHTAPNPYPAGGGPYWCGFIITATWQTYLNYGDTRILEKYYPTMQKWLAYVDKYSETGLLKRWPDTDYRAWYLGDWAVPRGVDQKSEKSIDLVNNSFVCVCYDDMQKIARVLKKTADVQKYAQKLDALKKQVNQTFFDAEKNSYADGYQIDLAYPLLAGIVPEQSIKNVEQSLYTEIQQNRDGHLACGLVGIPVLTEWATKNQDVQLFYAMLKKKDYPGYLYMIENGATTTWEEWDNPRSHIHNCFNGIGSWFYEAVGGIRKDPDFPAYQQVIIQPQIPDGISWANTTKETPFGPLVVNWKLEGPEFNMHLQVPVGVKAKVVIPENVKSYSLNGKERKLKEGETSVIVESGEYGLGYRL
jgi:alpha-L-rhamnosidase